jgi:selenocysteine lyase/cysteine desulfurase
VRRWFDVDDKTQLAIEERIRAGDRLASYGVVRASVGLQNEPEDVDALADALTTISKNGSRFVYEPVTAEETFRAVSAR